MNIFIAVVGLTLLISFYLCIHNNLPKHGTVFQIVIASFIIFSVIYIICACIMLYSVRKICQDLNQQRQFNHNKRVIYLHLVFFLFFIILYLSSIVELFLKNDGKRAVEDLYLLSSSITQISNTVNLVFVMWLTNKFTRIPSSSSKSQTDDNRSSVDSLMSFDQHSHISNNQVVIVQQMQQIEETKSTAPESKESRSSINDHLDDNPIPIEQNAPQQLLRSS